MTFPGPQTPQPGPNPGGPKASPQRWAVLTVFSKRAARIQREAEGFDCGGFLPTYASVRYRDGKRSSSERQLLPGYLFVRLGLGDEARIANIDGVYGVLMAGERATNRLEAEMAPLVVGHASGRWNELQAPPAEKGERRRRHRRRRPRPGKRARAARRAAVAHSLTE